jgi:hypothetical protein
MSDWQAARSAIEGKSWADDMARASISAAEAKFSPAAGSEVFVTAASYRISLASGSCYAADSANMRYWAIRVERLSAHYRYEPDGWIVVDGHQVLSRDGTWDYGPQDAASVPAWMESHSHRTAGLAIGAAREFAPKVTVNGMTAVEQMARHRERNMGCCGD